MSLRTVHFLIQAIIIVGGAYALGQLNAAWPYYLSLCLPAYFIGRAVSDLA